MTESKFKQAIRNIAKLHNFMPITISPPPVGIPDLLLIDNKNKSVVFIELKVNDNSLSHIQKHIINKLKSNGYICKIIRYNNTEDMSSLLKSDKVRFVMSDLKKDFSSIIYGNMTEINIVREKKGNRKCRIK